MRLLWIVGAAAVAAGLFGSNLTGPRSAASSNPVEARARRDEAVMVRPDDPAVLAARERGRATLDRFLVLNENRPPNSRAFSVKIPVRDGAKVEWFWVADPVRQGEHFSGLIDNTPRTVGTVRQGERVHFTRADIADWTYVQDGRVKGNFTACALLAKEPDVKAREAFMHKIGLDCAG